MRIQDLVFIGAFLGTVAALLRAAIAALRRRWSDARRILTRLTVFGIAYLLLVSATSLLSPRRWISLGEEQRFDDWALTVLRVSHTAQRYHVDIRVASHARGRPQRAADAGLALVASDGRRFWPLPAPDARSLQSVLQPGEWFETARDYDVDPQARIIGLDVLHGGWPALFIIGDRGSLFHQRPLVRAE
jgi:hypothetical protein